MEVKFSKILRGIALKRGGERVRDLEFCGVVVGARVKRVRSIFQGGADTLEDNI